MAKEVTPEHLKELSNSIELAKDGYWMPLAIICFLFMIIIALLVIQWNNYKKTNERRHYENETLMKELARGNIQLNILVTKHEVEIDNLKDKRK